MTTTIEQLTERRVERLHSRIARSRNGYRVDKSRSMGRDEVSDMKQLEMRGRAMFVSGFGWVDTEPAIRRAEQTRLAGEGSGS